MHLYTLVFLYLSTILLLPSCGNKNNQPQTELDKILDSNSTPKKNTNNDLSITSNRLKNDFDENENLNISDSKKKDSLYAKAIKITNVPSDFIDLNLESNTDLLFANEDEIVNLNSLGKTVYISAESKFSDEKNFVKQFNILINSEETNKSSENCKDFALYLIQCQSSGKSTFGFIPVSNQASQIQAKYLCPGYYQAISVCTESQSQLKRSITVEESVNKFREIEINRSTGNESSPSNFLEDNPLTPAGNIHLGADPIVAKEQDNQKF